MTTVRCAFHIEGPARPSGVVAWRRQCKRRVRIPDDEISGYCHDHRPYGTTAWKTRAKPNSPPGDVPAQEV